MGVTETRTIHEVQSEADAAATEATDARVKLERGEISDERFGEIVDRYKALVAEYNGMVRALEAGREALRPYLEPGRTVADAVQRAYAAGDRRAAQLATEMMRVTGGRL